MICKKKSRRITVFNRYKTAFSATGGVTWL